MAMVKQLNSLWDLESVSVSKYCKIDLILCSLVKELKSLKHERVFAIEGFVGVFDSDRIGHNTRLELLSKGIRVTSSNSRKPQSMDNLLTKRSREWAEKCPNGVLILFASDGDYINLKREISKRPNLETVLIYEDGKIGKNLDYFPHPHVNWNCMLERGGVIRPVAKNVTEADALGVVARTAGTPVCESRTSNVVWSSFDAGTSRVVWPLVGSKEASLIMPNEGGVKRIRREEKENYGFAD